MSSRGQEGNVGLTRSRRSTYQQILPGVVRRLVNRRLQGIEGGRSRKGGGKGGVDDVDNPKARMLKAGLEGGSRRDDGTLRPVGVGFADRPPGQAVVVVVLPRSLR